jgi:V/A-type H+-transporting ATPase subunit E
MKNGIENLEGVISKLKNQGIKEGETEKKRIIESAQQEAKNIVSEAKVIANKKLKKAENEISVFENNSKAALKQASRDFIEATKVALLNHLQSVFSNHVEKLFTQEQYLQELLKTVIENIPADKTVSVSPELAKKMQAYLKTISFKEKIELKPLANSGAKILVEKSDKSKLQFVLSSQEVQNAMFSLINKDLINKIITLEAV